MLHEPAILFLFSCGLLVLFSFIFSDNLRGRSVDRHHMIDGDLNV